MLRFTLTSLCALGLMACSHINGGAVDPVPSSADQTSSEVTAGATAASTEFANIPWKPSNPKAPQGVMVHILSRNSETGAFNAIVKIPAGLKIPLHTHSANFNAVTLSDGMVHASQTGVGSPLAKGSMWTQPGDEPHVDECHGEADCVLMVFFDGAIDTHFVDAPAADPKMVVTPADKVVWKAVRPEMENSPRIAILSGNPKEGAFSALFEFPAGMATNVHSHTARFVGAVISGTHHRGSAADQLMTLTTGAVWSEKSGAPHMEQCGMNESCVIAVQMDGALDEKQVEITTAQASVK